VKTAVILALALQAAAGQSRPAFEVASVKPNASGEPRVMIRTEPNGRFTVVNVPLRVLIRTAYGIAEDSRIVAAPGWIDSARFDIVAKPPEGTAPLTPGGAVGPMNLMLQSLLEDRFRLSVRREVRELPLLVLTSSGGSRTPGPKLRRTAVNCAEILAKLFPPPGSGPAPPQPAVPPGDAPPCGSSGGPGRIVAQGMTMARLASNLAGRVRQVVVDKTGLEGDFDLELDWTPDQFQGGGALGALPGTPAAPAPDGPGVSIYTALQEQLGLTLQSTRGPVDVLVIERVEQPSPD
jgi:uncharacterized protein (TIGR03435 family)